MSMVEWIGLDDLVERGWLELGRGKVISKKDLASNPGRYPVYSSASLNDGKFGEYGAYMFDEELITWSVDGGGNLFYRPQHRFSVTNVGGFIRVKNPERIFCKYLYHVLTALHSRLNFDWSSKAHPSVIVRLYSNIFLPPLYEQRRIAAILDKADALRTKRREATAQLDRLAQSIFLDMFGDPVTNPKDWPKEKIMNLGMVVTGNTPSRAVSSNYGHAIEWIKSDNINTPHYYLTKASEGLSEAGRQIGRTAPTDSILVTCIAGSPNCIGNSAMTNREVAFNQQINAFIPRIGNPHFHYAQFVVGKKLIQQASTDGMKGMVSKGKFEQIEVPLPPEKLQEAFAERALALVAMTNCHAQSLHQLDKLFASLQHQAFRGEL